MLVIIESNKNFFLPSPDQFDQAGIDEHCIFEIHQFKEKIYFQTGQ